MNIKEYTVENFKRSDFTDRNGNHWSDILFEEHRNEPVKVVHQSKTEYKPGQKVWGELKPYQTQNGKTLMRFYRKKKPEQQSFIPKKRDKSYEDGMALGNALNNATQLYIAYPNPDDYLEALKMVRDGAQIILNQRDDIDEEEEKNLDPQTPEEAKELKNELLPQGEVVPLETEEIDYSQIPF